MSSLRESYVLELPADLQAGRDAVGGVLTWLRFQGHRPETLKRWRLPLTEAVNNAIIHGCRDRTPARVSISARVNGTGTEVQVGDPGHYTPRPETAELNPDLFAEHGRGAFLIAQGTERVEHRNGENGHTLTLAWSKPLVAPDHFAAAASAEGAVDQLAQQLGEAYETLTAYAEFAGLLATTADFPELLGQLRQRLALTVPHEHFLLRFCRGNTLALAESAMPFSPSISSSAPSLEAGVFASRNSVALVSPAEIPATDPLALARGPLVVVPVGSRQKQRGSLALVRRADAPAFTAGQIAFTQVVADFLGTAQSLSELWTQRSEQAKLEQELQLAAQIQQRLLPQTKPALAGWNVTGECRPSRAMGGDYYDWFVRPDGTCLVLVADVMGKGMPAALIATMLRSTWRTLAARTDGPGRLFTELNAQLAPDLAALEVFITAVLIQLSPRSGRVAYANAGHCGVLQRPAGERIFRCHDTGGLPLGIDAAADYAETVIVSARGDSLFAFTDGCYEYDRTNGGAAGFAQLTAELHAAVELQPANIVTRILQNVQDRTGGDLPDDCTLVALQHLS